MPAPCLTPALLPFFLASQPIPYPPPPPGGLKGQRDVYELSGLATSENFALRWGGADPPTEAEAERLLASLELSWAKQVGELGMPLPYGADAYLFNVYVGDSGEGAPSDANVAGYYTTDAQGWPMIVLGQDTLRASADTLTTVPHELFHALQHATGNYGYSDEAAWYWEATATWMESVVYPDDPVGAIFLFGYAFLPHLPVDFFDYYDTGAFTEYHQYGAFIFPLFVAEQVADEALVVATWLDPRGESAPLDALEEHLADEGVDLDAVIADFAAHNATWDYQRGDWYSYYLDYYAGYYAEYDHRIADAVSADGTGGWTDPPADTLPGRHGYNVVDLSDADLDDAWLAFAGDAEGSAGRAAAWSLTLVEGSGASAAYTVLDVEGGQAEVRLGELSGGERYLIVVPSAEGHDTDEIFGYRYALTEGPLSEEPGPDDTGEPADDTGGEGGDGDTPGGEDGPVADEDSGESGGKGVCGYTGAASAGGWLAPLAALALLRRRRRYSV